MTRSLPGVNVLSLYDIHGNVDALDAAVRGLPVNLVMVYQDRPLVSLLSRPELRAEKVLTGRVGGGASRTA